MTPASGGVPDSGSVRGRRSWIGRGIDALAALVLLAAVYRFLLAPRLFPAAPVAAPPLQLARLDGHGTFSLAARRGRVVFLDFWASWCEPCRAILPLVEHYARAHADVDVVAVDSGESASVAGAFARTHNLANVVLDPDETAAAAYGVSGYPTMVVIDPTGMIRAKWVGFNPAIESAMADAGRRYAAHARLPTNPVPGTPARAEAAELPVPQLAVEDEPNSLDTIRNTPFGWQLGPLTQGYLFLVDDRGALVPDRATVVPTRANGGISADGRAITYHLRTGRWSDGAVFDARDLAFTIEALRNPRTAVPDTSAVAPIASYAVPRPDTLVVHLRAPSAPFVASFLTEGANDPFSILPRHVAARYSSLDRSSLDTDPVGLGPFRLTRWIRGERLEFERNPYYWRGPAASARLDVRVVPSASTRFLLARTGALDEIEVTGLAARAAQRTPGLRLVATTTNIVDYLQCNLHAAVCADRSVRRAIAQAIDRVRLAQAVYHGTLVPADAMQLDPRYRTLQRIPAYDPQAARALVRGRRVVLNFAIASAWRDSQGAAVQIAADLAAAGIDAQIHGYTEAEFWGAKEAGGVLEGGRYDLALTSWSPALDPDRSYLFGCAATPPGGGNSMYFCNAAYDRDERLGAASYDPAQRAPYYRDAGAILVRELPVVPLGFERRTYAVSTRLAGFRPNALGRDLWNAWELRI
ncbi:MAG: ABC transporter substrate-binding protein [Candidatus Velthaea sp.]|jgi:peptide/nickel transport system substrate-binding protein